MLDQTRTDLEALLTAVQDHWPRDGCMLSCMNFVTNNGILRMEHSVWLRHNAMMAALGFDPPRGAQPGGMFHWNDEPGRTKDQVLERIKDALNT